MEEITLGSINTIVIFLTTLIGGLIILYGYIKKWVKRVIEQEIKSLNDRVSKLEIDSKINKEENTILLKGQLACLKGLKEQGCDGPVTISITEIEDYLLKQVHR